VEGTLIVAEAVNGGVNPVKSIACKQNITAVSITSTRMLMAHGFLRKIFEVFDRHETAVDMVTTSEVNVSLTIDNTRHLASIQTELAQFSEVSIEENQAIVSLVGDNIRHTPGIAARVFGAMNGINIRMISQGASRLNISFVVDGADLKRSVVSLHTEFFSTLDPAVFD
jgi:aspartate kinase